MKFISDSRRRRFGYRQLSAARGFSLIEVTLALGVAGFCLISLFGLLPVGLSSNQTSLDQTMAANIAGAIVADLRCAQPVVTGSSPHFGFMIPYSGAPGGSTMTAGSTPQTLYLAANGSPTGAVGSPPVTSGSAISIYRATLGFAPPANGRTATPVRVLISWPALADSNPVPWPSNYSGSYEADTTLDRN